VGISREGSKPRNLRERPSDPTVALGAVAPSRRESWPRNFKLIPVSLLPFGREIVTIEQARAMGLAPEVAVPANPGNR
jgi:hypothetical protein